MRMWQPITTVPLDRVVEVAVLDADGEHVLAFPCRRAPHGWIDAATQRRLDVRPTHWREWSGDLSALRHMPLWGWSGVPHTNRSIANENILHFCNRLRTQIDPAARSRLQKLLIEEEDKLGASLDMLSQIDRELNGTKALIERLTALAAAPERDRCDGTGERPLLEGLERTRLLIEGYRLLILAKLNDSRTWD